MEHTSRPPDQPIPGQSLRETTSVNLLREMRRSQQAKAAQSSDSATKQPVAESSQSASEGGRPSVMPRNSHELHPQTNDASLPSSDATGDYQNILAHLDQFRPSTSPSAHETTASRLDGLLQELQITFQRAQKVCHSISEKWGTTNTQADLDQPPAQSPPSHQASTALHYLTRSDSSSTSQPPTGTLYKIGTRQGDDTGYTQEVFSGEPPSSVDPGLRERCYSPESKDIYEQYDISKEKFVRVVRYIREKKQRADTDKLTANNLYYANYQGKEAVAGFRRDLLNKAEDEQTRRIKVNDDTYKRNKKNINQANRLFKYIKEKYEYEGEPIRRKTNGNKKSFSALLLEAQTKIPNFDTEKALADLQVTFPKNSRKAYRTLARPSHNDLAGWSEHA